MCRACPGCWRIARERLRGALALALGWTLAAAAVLAVQAALGLDFDPRYRDFPFAPLTGAVFPFLVLSLLGARAETTAPGGRSCRRGRAGISALYIAFNETFANWQAIWLCAGLAALAITLVRVADAPD